MRKRQQIRSERVNHLQTLNKITVVVQIKVDKFTAVRICYVIIEIFIFDATPMPNSVHYFKYNIIGTATDPFDPASSGKEIHPWRTVSPTVGKTHTYLALVFAHAELNSPPVFLSAKSTSISAENFIKANIATLGQPVGGIYFFVSFCFM